MIDVQSVNAVPISCSTICIPTDWVGQDRDGGLMLQIIDRNSIDVRWAVQYASWAPTACPNHNGYFYIPNWNTHLVQYGESETASPFYHKTNTEMQAIFNCPSRVWELFSDYTEQKSTYDESKAWVPSVGYRVYAFWKAGTSVESFNLMTVGSARPDFIALATFAYTVDPLFIQNGHIAKINYTMNFFRLFDGGIVGELSSDEWATGWGSYTDGDNATKIMSAVGTAWSTGVCSVAGLSDFPESNISSWYQSGLTDWGMIIEDEITADVCGKVKSLTYDGALCQVEFNPAYSTLKS